MEENKECFFAEEIIFTYYGGKPGDAEISEIDDFPGKDDFITFYTVHNGGNFTNGAWFYPENGYEIPKCDEPYISLEGFLSIPTSDVVFRMNMECMKDIMVEKCSMFEDFILFHIPFATDVTGNPFWIDIQSGEIKYTDFEKSTNPDDAVTVAFSFINFCKRIKPRNL